MIIETLEPKTFALWDSYVDTHPDATCYHSRHWKRVAERAYQLRAPFFIARAAKTGACCGVLPTFLVRGLLRSHMTNGLFGAYGSILADTSEVRHQLVEHARLVCDQENFKFLMFKTLEDDSSETSFKSFEKINPWVIATLPLQSDPALQWKSLKDKTRNCVRKAMKHGIEVRKGKDQLPFFYEVLAENMHDKGAPIYGYSFMEELIHSFASRAEVLTLWHEGRAISGALLLDHGKTTYVPFASSRPSSLSMSPNNLLYWEIIQRGCLSGMQRLDFGRSIRDSGPLKFKLGWGAQTQPQPAFFYSPANKGLDLNPDDPIVSFFVRQWRRMPRSVVNTVGPSICKQLAGLI